VGTGEMVGEFRQVQLKELDVLGVFRYCNVYRPALDLVSRGCYTSSGKRIDLKQMVTHRFSLDQVNDAFQAAKHDPTAVKVVIQPNPSLE
jgi:L-iditol 2-dehydrogenase